ncbi:hypothetical protein, partial [Proteus mirabilis]|uniref:hypothetical protein n=1 Tax=Proteus mirabilis TaxID=584 RepID=UPI002574C02B
RARNSPCFLRLRIFEFSLKIIVAIFASYVIFGDWQWSPSTTRAAVAFTNPKNHSVVALKIYSERS